MTDLEDRLRREMPSLTDALIEVWAARPDKAENGTVADVHLLAEFAPQQAHRTRRWPTVALAAAVVAVAVGVAALLLDTPHDAEVTTVEQPPVDPAALLPVADSEMDDPKPAEEAAPAVLKWTEIDPPFTNAFGLDSVGDGRILTRVHQEDGWRVAVTSDGTDWMDVSIPDGIRPGLVDISGDRWLVAGFELDDDSVSSHHLGVLQHVGTRLFYSDDAGDTWVELALDYPAPETAVPYLIKRSRLGAALADGEQIVIALSSVTALDLWTLTRDRGLAPDLGEIIAVGWTTRDITVEHRQVGDRDLQRSVFTFDELGLTADQVDVLRHLGADSLTHVFTSDGSAPELVGAYSGWNTYGVVAADGFVLHVEGSTDRLLTSADGTDWTEIPMDPSYVCPPYPVAVDSSGSIWAITTVSGSATVVKGLDLLNGFETVAVLPGAACIVELDAGPAGLAVTARSAVDNVDGTQEMHEPWVWGGLDTLVGWSADGVDWEWSTVGDAFGINEGEPLVRLAVGEDLVLANVVTYEDPFDVTLVTDPQLGLLTYPMPTGAARSRWFIAEIPGG